jgi:hypothetical protein
MYRRAFGKSPSELRGACNDLGLAGWDRRPDCCASD